MKTKTKKIKEYIIDDEEADIINLCLIYCRHRLRRHQPCGLHVDKKIFNKLVEEFKERKALK